MKISREELYRRVWELPVVTLAKEFDISDVGLSKACRANDIPLPPRGHWVKLQHGKTVTKPALPPSTVTAVVIDAPRHRLPVPPNRKRPASAEPQKIVLEAPSPSHQLAPFAKATKQQLVSGKPTHELVHLHKKDLFDCQVSRGAIEEACQLLDAIEKAAPGYALTLVPGEKTLEFVHDGQAVAFRLSEQFTTSQEPLPGKQYASWERPPLVYHFTGKFTLELSGYFEGRKKWADGKRQRLADVLVDFMEGLVFAAKALKQRKIEFEERDRQWREEAERRAERERREKDLLDFRNKLLAEIQAQQQHAELKEYVESLQRELSTFVGPLPESTRQWLATAELWAHAADPVLQRMRLLASGIKMDYYSGSFGRPVP
ncbi:hypothetical protein [Hydrogenophaga sp.]|uniref:hypothetical protein n=1 Tax=Hydrogenophaga sp. TaxID=1904254 RepID=UPI003AF7A958